MPAETERAWSILTSFEEFRWEAVGLWLVEKSVVRTFGTRSPLWSLSLRVVERKSMKRSHLALGVSDLAVAPPSWLMTARETRDGRSAAETK